MNKANTNQILTFSQREGRGEHERERERERESNHVCEGMEPGKKNIRWRKTYGIIGIERENDSSQALKCTLSCKCPRWSDKK